MPNFQKRTLWLSLSPWAILASLAIMGPLAVFLTTSSIKRDKENMTRLLVEKGAALIRSFEAGARTGMIGMGWGSAQVQRLLVETARQSDILYLVVTDKAGIAVAHSSPDSIGNRHRTTKPHPTLSSDDSQRVFWRQVQMPGGGFAFEVYKLFTPMVGTRGGRGNLRTEMGIPPPPKDQDGASCPPEKSPQGDWCRFYWNPDDVQRGPKHTIFVGLDMSALESARVEAKGRAILISVGIVLIALAGIVSLFLSEGYKLTRRSLAKVRAFSDQVVDKLPVGLIASDEQGRVAAFNETAETILAVSSQRILGGTAAGAVPSELWALSERLDRQGAIIEEDLECKAAGRGHLPLRVSAVSLRGQDGTFLGYVFIFRDLTEVRRLQQELERSRRLAALGNLAAGVAHEIRNPLSSIKGFATYFRERFKDEPEDWGTANIMIQEVERLDRVIGQLLEFARPSGLRVRSVHLHDVIKHSLKLVESDARARGVEVTSMVHEDLAPVAMDADRMNQALLNLYLNAIQAMPEGGKLVVEVSRDESLKQTRITVGDTGPGIEPRDLERIFDPYFTTKPNGTGLGLAIVHKIIEAHGGDLEVKSVLSQGTTVTMILPHMEEARDAY